MRAVVAEQVGNGESAELVGGRRKILVETVAVEHANKTPEELFVEGSIWTHIPKGFDAGHLFQEGVKGTGLIPPGIGIQNGILMAFQYAPSGILAEREPASQKWAIETDVARRVRSSIKLEKIVNGELVTEDETPMDKAEFPLEAEKPNDSPDNSKEMIQNFGNVDYAISYDAPGRLGRTANAGDSKWTFKADFQEFVRIDIDHPKPSGEVVAGSIASPFINWHVRHELVVDAGTSEWIRSTGDEMETDDNDIGPGFVFP